MGEDCPRRGGLEGKRTTVKQTYRVMAGLIALGVLVQAAAIAFGWFDAISEIDNGLVIDENYEGNAGHMLHGIERHDRDAGAGPDPADRVLLRREGGPAARAKWAGIVFGLIVLQVALAFVSFAAPIVGVLHGINALAHPRRGGARGRADAARRRVARQHSAGRSTSRRRPPAPPLRSRPVLSERRRRRWWRLAVPLVLLVAALGTLGWFWWSSLVPVDVLRHGDGARRLRWWAAHEHGGTAAPGERRRPDRAGHGRAGRRRRAGGRPGAVRARQRRGDRRLHAQRQLPRARARGAAGRPRPGHADQRRRGRRGDAALARGRRAERRGRRRRGHPGRRGARGAVRLPLRRGGRRHVLVPLPPGLPRPGARWAVRHPRRPAARRHRRRRTSSRPCTPTTDGARSTAGPARIRWSPIRRGRSACGWSTPTTARCGRG